MEIRDWLLTISMILHFARTVWDYVDKRNDKTNERIAELTGQVEELERSVVGLRAEAKASPSHADLGKVYDAIRDLSNTTNESIKHLAGTVNQMAGENRGQSDTLRLILNQIMQKGMK